MKSTWFSTRDRYEFAKLVSESDYSNHGFSVFDDFLRVASGSLRQAVNVMCSGQKDEKLEEDVKRSQRAVKYPQKFAQAFCKLTDMMEQSQEDHLGSVYQEWDIHSKRSGQFFTPPTVADCMARMQMHDLMEHPPGHRIKIMEPACGAGQMLISVSNLMKEHGLGPHRYFCWGVDVDWRCVAMCYIQLTLLDVPAILTIGNSLTLEMQESWITLRGAMMPYREPNPESETKPSQPKTQRLLFA